MRHFFSDLNINGDLPVRVQPGLGEWGTSRVPTTREKNRARWQVAGAGLGITVALCWLGWTFYTILMGG
ncbi:hypothetical protein [Propionibacterium sp. oral taxon 192]|uniref:hypothetical protein n=1 Tax=Propionibacterium sp. oral taxon 192 TaxID=671222 RepID=UPI0012EBB34A|nr:hypothetical protein [Propionibacterium sp. oral taxon 192]